MYLIIDANGNSSVQSDFSIDDNLLGEVFDKKLKVFNFKDEYCCLQLFATKEENQLIEGWSPLFPPRQEFPGDPNTISQILERNPKWHELVKPERGYLSVSEPDYIHFVSRSEPYWNASLTDEIQDEIDSMEVGEEIVVVQSVDVPPSWDEECDEWVYFEVIPLPVPFVVED